MTKKIINKIKENWKFYDLKDGQFECSQHTNGGVEMVIYIDKNNIIKDFEEYLDNFDIDSEIDMYRQDQDYKNNFTISESIQDFKDFLEDNKKLLEV